MKTRSSRAARAALSASALVALLAAGCTPWPAGYKWDKPYFGLGAGAGGPGTAENTYVKMIQAQLNAVRANYTAIGFIPESPYPWRVLDVDGYFGRGSDGNWATYNAVQEFQFLQGLPVTGAVGRTEWEHLFSDSWKFTKRFYRQGYSTCFGPTIFPNTGSGLPTSYPGIALHNHNASRPKGEQGHLFLVEFFDRNWRPVSQQKFVQIDGMASTESTVDITPSALLAAGFKCGDNPNVIVSQIN